jgi:hypothetical protein
MSLKEKICSCGEILYPEVLRSFSGYYVGYYCPHCGPHSRETEYFKECGVGLEKATEAFRMLINKDIDE